LRNVRIAFEYEYAFARSIGERRAEQRGEKKAERNSS